MASETSFKLCNSSPKQKSPPNLGSPSREIARARVISASGEYGFDACVITQDSIESKVKHMLPKRSKSKLAGKLAHFVQEYARKAHKGWDPNDRNYDRKLEEKMKRLSPEDLSELLYGDDISHLEKPEAGGKSD